MSHWTPSWGGSLDKEYLQLLRQYNADVDMLIHCITVCGFDPDMGVDGLSVCTWDAQEKWQVRLTFEPGDGSDWSEVRLLPRDAAEILQQASSAWEAFVLCCDYAGVECAR